MKKFFIVLSILIVCNFFCFSEITIDTVWGAWDYHYDEYGYETLQCVSANGISYLRETQAYIVFEKSWKGKFREDWNGKSVIEEPGIVYLIEDYSQEGNKFIFHVRYQYSTAGDEDTMDFIIHFIDENHMWHEDFNTKAPPKQTDIMTRMPTIESLNIPVITLNEGDLMYCNDNLRLRTKPSVYNPESKVLVSMKKGTKVKVMQKYNWPGYIDGIVSDWVQVEVIEDSFDKDGKPLPKGTRGWCFGAYLTLIDDGSK